MILWLMAFMARVKATWSPQAETKHQGDVVEVRIRNSWVMLVLSVPVTRYKYILFVMDVLYSSKAAN